MIVTGSFQSARRLVNAVSQTKLRSRIVLVRHARIDRVPLAPEDRALFDCVDAIVTESSFGRRAIMALYSESERQVTCPVFCIPLGIDTSVFAIVSPPVREQTRRELLGTGADKLIVGCWLDHLDHRLGFALHVFGQIVSGTHWECPKCKTHNVAKFDEELLGLSPQSHCRKCEYINGEEPQPIPNIHLHILGIADMRDGKGVDIDYTLQMGLRDKVSFDSCGIASPLNDPVAFAARFNAFDIFFLPADGAAIHSSILCASAAGVPTVSTSFGDAEEHLVDSARLIPVATWQLHSDGYLQAHLDVASTVRALHELSSSLSLRNQLGKTAKTVVQNKLSSEETSRQWAEVIVDIMAICKSPHLRLESDARRYD